MKYFAAYLTTAHFKYPSQATYSRCRQQEALLGVEGLGVVHKAKMRHVDFAIPADVDVVIAVVLPWSEAVRC